MVICTALFQHGTLFQASNSRVCLDELKVKTDEDCTKKQREGPEEWCGTLRNALRNGVALGNGVALSTDHIRSIAI